MIIIDTNVLSEVQKPTPNPNVMAWLDAQEPGDLYVAAITAEELMFGAFILPAGDRRTRLIGAIEGLLETSFNGRILPYDITAATFYAMRVSSARQRGITIGHADGQIGAIAAAQKAAKVATRDSDPFKAMNLEVINPWEYCP